MYLKKCILRQQITRKTVNSCSLYSAVVIFGCVIIFGWSNSLGSTGLHSLNKAGNQTGTQPLRAVEVTLMTLYRVEVICRGFGDDRTLQVGTGLRWSGKRGRQVQSSASIKTDVDRWSHLTWWTEDLLQPTQMWSGKAKSQKMLSVSFISFMSCLKRVLLLVNFVLVW